jgi:hypothetical protein
MHSTGSPNEPSAQQPLAHPKARIIKGCSFFEGNNKDLLIYNSLNRKQGLL